MTANIRAPNARTNNGTRRSLSPQDRRDFIPVLGLREYWYPGIPDKAVGKKPVLVRMLGRDVCFWRGRNGVVAFDNYCPHRGGMLHNADQWWPGTITCTYHGATFNEQGELLEYICEGPDSKIVGKMRCGVYPTRTLKGVVFVWMGEAEPAPIEEDVPPEFFSDDFHVWHALHTWDCNWRQGIENVNDGHAPYVHRNSSRFLWNPIVRQKTFLKPVIINGRALAQPQGRAGATADVVTGNLSAGAGFQGKATYQEFYPRGQFMWPRHKWRLLWTWAFRWHAQRAAKRPKLVSDPEWDYVMHLPCMWRGIATTAQFTRWIVPIDEDRMRLFYFHAIKPQNRLALIYEKLQYVLWHEWSMNVNFSGQDARQMVYQYYDKPEKLSVADATTIMWRKLVFQARGMSESLLDGITEAEEFAGLEEEDENATITESFVQTGRS